MTLTEIDERKGLVRTYWKDVRERVASVDAVFAKLIDELSPDKNYPLYLAYYDYGVFTGDTISAILPDSNGSYYRLSDTKAPKKLNNI
jgi:hypothetical protein